MTAWKRVALTLVIIGAINWGLIGLFQFDLVAALFGGQATTLSRIVYALVGISGIFSIVMLFQPMSEEETRDSVGDVNYGTELGDEMHFDNDEKE